MQAETFFLNLTTHLEQLFFPFIADFLYYLCRARNCARYGLICDLIFLFVTRKKRVVANLRLGFALSDAK